MPKLKVHRSTKKRIIIKKSAARGTILLRGQANRTHFNQKKSSARKRRISGLVLVKGAIARNLKRAKGV